MMLIDFSIILLSMPGPLELGLILLAVLLLFGAKRLPELARSLGQAIREFKESLFGKHKKTDQKDEK